MWCESMDCVCVHSVWHACVYGVYMSSMHGVYLDCMCMCAYAHCLLCVGDSMCGVCGVSMIYVVCMVVQGGCTVERISGELFPGSRLEGVLAVLAVKVSVFLTT